MEQEQVIVSLTSFPAALGSAVGAVKSVLRGNVLPDKVILYLNSAEFQEAGAQLPEALSELAEQNPRFEIRFYDEKIRSYGKLIPALADFPEAVIVTVDDDVDYSPDMLKELLKWHKRYPEAVISHRAKRILPDKPYRKWPKYRWYHFLRRKINSGFENMQTGCAGTLYPPHCLDESMLDSALFTKMAPTSDDIWFWAAAVARGNSVIPVPFGQNKPKGLYKPRELELKTRNFKAGMSGNDLAIKAILEHYPIIKQRLIYGK